ncbi:MAG: hypothetical protein SVT56_13765, partial [Chloroflexota bacterium]|nr:hypothetical protein [Chloroflexota bacterium]
LTNYIRMSPDRGLILFGNVIIDTQAKTQAQIPSLGRPLWFPDGQGLLGNGPLLSLSLSRPGQVNQQSTTSLTTILKLSAEADNIELISWSPDGRYLVYRLLSSDGQPSFQLLDIFSGQSQTFQPTSTLRVSGWLSQ